MATIIMRLLPVFSFLLLNSMGQISTDAETENVQKIQIDLKEYVVIPQQSKRLLGHLKPNQQIQVVVNTNGWAPEHRKLSGAEKIIINSLLDAPAGQKMSNCACRPHPWSSCQCIHRLLKVHPERLNGQGIRFRSFSCSNFKRKGCWNAESWHPQLEQCHECEKDFLNTGPLDIGSGCRILHEQIFENMTGWEVYQPISDALNNDCDMVRLSNYQTSKVKFHISEDTKKVWQSLINKNATQAIGELINKSKENIGENQEEQSTKTMASLNYNDVKALKEDLTKLGFDKNLLEILSIYLQSPANVANESELMLSFMSDTHLRFQKLHDYSIVMLKEWNNKMISQFTKQFSRIHKFKPTLRATGAKLRRRSAELSPSELAFRLAKSLNEHANNIRALSINKRGMGPELEILIKNLGVPSEIVDLFNAYLDNQKSEPETLSDKYKRVFNHAYNLMETMTNESKTINIAFINDIDDSYSSILSQLKILEKELQQIIGDSTNTSSLNDAPKNLHATGKRTLLSGKQKPVQASRPEKQKSTDASEHPKLGFMEEEQRKIMIAELINDLKKAGVAVSITNPINSFFLKKGLHFSPEMSYETIHVRRALNDIASSIVPKITGSAENIKAKAADSIQQFESLKEMIMNGNLLKSSSTLRKRSASVLKEFIRHTRATNNSKTQQRSEKSTINKEKATEARKDAINKRQTIDILSKLKELGVPASLLPLFDAYWKNFNDNIDEKKKLVTKVDAVVIKLKEFKSTTEALQEKMTPWTKKILEGVQAFIELHNIREEIVRAVLDSQNLPKKLKGVNLYQRYIPTYDYEDNENSFPQQQNNPPPREPTNQQNLPNPQQQNLPNPPQQNVPNPPQQNLPNPPQQNAPNPPQQNLPNPPQRMEAGSGSNTGQGGWKSLLTYDYNYEEIPQQPSQQFRSTTRRPTTRRPTTGRPTTGRPTTGLPTTPPLRRIGQRKEFRQLTQAERQAFSNAYRQVMNTQISGNQRLVDMFIQYHTTGENLGTAHSNPLFLPWHREYIFRLEQAMQGFDSSVFLPYWDTTLDQGLDGWHQSIMFLDETFGRTNEAGRVVSGPSGFQTINTPQCGFSQVYRYFHNGPNRLISAREVDFIVGARTLREMEQPNRNENWQVVPRVVAAISGYHGNVHTLFDERSGDTIISTMSHLTCAPADVVFFMLHTFVDYLWERVRLNNPSRYTDYPSFNQNAPNADFIVLPFNVTIRDTVSNMYEQYFTYSQAPSIIRCQVPRDCGGDGDMLYCAQNGRCRTRLRAGSSCTTNDQCYASQCRNNRCAR